ncbi:MAG: DUF1731 domain-containing protein [Opitutaceae bacterium]
MLPAPAAPLRLLLGGLADELLLGSQRVRPERLEAAGFPFAFPTIEAAMRHELGRTGGVKAEQDASAFRGALATSNAR